MSTIVTRTGKGTTLTWAEADANFTNLNTDKVEINGALGTPTSLVLTNATGTPTSIGLVNGTGLPAAGVTGTALTLAGGTLTGQLSFASGKGINGNQTTMVNHATTADIWAAGDTIFFSSAVTVTAIPNSPGPGVTRRLFPATGTIYTHNGGNINMQGGASYTTAAGDMLVVVSKSTTQNFIYIVKAAVVAGAATQIQPISASVAANALTITAPSLTLDFRSATLTSGTVTTVTGDPADLVISSGSTLGTVSGIASRLAVIAMNNAGTIELAVRNVSAGANLDEGALISTTAEGGAGAADSATVNYSTTARSNLAFRVIGYLESTQATAGTWATAPSTIQGEGGNAHAVASAWVIHTPVAAANQTAIDFTNIPAWATEVVVSILGGSLNASDAFLVQLGDAGGFETTGYSGTYIQLDAGGAQLSSGFRDPANAAADTKTGVYRLLLIDRATNTWHCVGSMSRLGTGDCSSIFGSKALTDTLTQVRVTQVAGTSQIDAGSFNYQYR